MQNKVKLSQSDLQKCFSGTMPVDSLKNNNLQKDRDLPEADRDYLWAGNSHVRILGHFYHYLSQSFITR